MMMHCAVQCGDDRGEYDGEFLSANDGLSGATRLGVFDATNKGVFDKRPRVMCEQRHIAPINSLSVEDEWKERRAIMP